MTQPDTRAHPQTASGAASVAPDTALHPPIDQPLSPPMLPPDRAQLRKHLLGLRRTTDSALRREWDALLGQHLLTWCRQHQPASLGLFWPIQAEPDLRSVYPLLHQMGVVLALPSLFRLFITGNANPTDRRWLITLLIGALTVNYVSSSNTPHSEGCDEVNACFGAQGQSLRWYSIEREGRLVLWNKGGRHPTRIIYRLEPSWTTAHTVISRRSAAGACSP